jgi:hypothetical protein
MPRQIQWSGDAFVGNSTLKTKLEECPVVANTLLLYVVSYNGHM